MTVVDLSPRARYQATGPSDDPRWEIRAGAGVAALFFLGLLGWGAFARMDEATLAPGVVTVSGHRQTIQAVDGGIVAAIDVREGDRVAAGQPLVEFSHADTLAAERSLAQRSIQVEAEIARLDAEDGAKGAIQPPADFAQLAPEDRPLAATALATEQTALAADYGAERARRGALQQRAAEAGDQIVGIQQQIDANSRQQRSVGQQLAGVRDLASQGYAPLNRVRALEQSVAALQGEAGAQAASIAQMKASASEARLQIAEGDNEHHQQLADERRRAEDALAQVQPLLKQAQARLAHEVARATVGGQVIGLAVNTVGGVVAPGQHLMEIVPANGQLVVEARISPADAGLLRIGQTAQVRPAGSDDPPLTGVVTRVSPDSTAGERDGPPYVEAEVTVSPRAAPHGRTDALRAGAPVEIVMPLRKRTALQYWFGPLLQNFERDFHER